MYRNEVLNPQASKAIRNILRDPKRYIADLSEVGLNSELIENWLYNVGSALLTADHVHMFNGTKVKPSNMGFDSVVKLMKRIVRAQDKDAQTVMQEWIRRGKQWEKLSASNPRLTTFDGTEDDISILTDPEEWGNIVNALKDIVGFSEAQKNVTRAKRRIALTFPGAEITEQELTYIPDNAAESPAIAQLEQRMLEARASGDPELVAQLESEIATTVGLKQAVSRTRSTKFEMTTQSKDDGRQSGMAIQAAQNRDIDMSGRVGIIYNADGNLIPDGDIRDEYTSMFNKAIVVQFGKARDPNGVRKFEFWKDFITMVDNANDSSDIRKLLSRGPLMEHSYGKGAAFNHAIVMEFLGSLFGQKVKQYAATTGIPGYAATETDPAGYRQLVDDMNTIIQTALTTTLDVDSQEVYKRVGRAWAMLGGSTPYFVGPLGNLIFLGSREAVVRNEIEIPGFDEPIPVVRTQSTGSARPGKANRKFNIDTLQWMRTHELAYGTELRNQMPVLTVQAQDAAILSRAILEVNQGREDNPRWGYFIHDSISSSVGSVRLYKRAYNRNFKKVVIDPEGFIQAEGVIQGLRQGIYDWKQLNRQANKDVVLNQTNAYRAVHDEIKKLELKEAAGRIVLAEEENFLKAARANGWKGSNSVVSAKQLDNIIIAFIKEFGVWSRLNDLKDTQIKNTAKYLPLVNNTIANL